MSEKELTYGETIKQPFPELEDIEITDGNFLEIQMEEWLSDIIRTLSSSSTIDFIPLEEQYSIAEQAYENGIEVTWKLKQIDQIINRANSRHRLADAMHLLAEDTSIVMEFYSTYNHDRGWHTGSFYVLDKADRDDKLSIRLKKDGVIIWSTIENEKTNV